MRDLMPGVFVALVLLVAVMLVKGCIEGASLHCTTPHTQPVLMPHSGRWVCMEVPH